MNPLIFGVMLNSALYLAGCFVAGLVTGNSAGWRLALAALGLTYVSYTLQAYQAAMAQRGNHDTAHFLGLTGFGTVWLSVVLGLFAGLAILF